MKEIHEESYVIGEVTNSGSVDVNGKILRFCRETSNFENIIQEINNGHKQCSLEVLIIDKEHAYAKERAEKLHIPYAYVIRRHMQARSLTNRKF